MPQPKNQDRQTAEEVADVKVEPAGDTDEPTFSVERLRREGDVILGFSKAEVAGAYHGAPDSRQVTVKDAKERVRDWLKAPVQPDPDQQPDTTV
jgi:hypothetical protein